MTFALLGALLGVANAQEAVAPAEPPASFNPATVSVVGHGVVHGEPDVALLELGVTETDPDVSAALARLDERIAAVMAALSALGVPERSIQTTSFNVWREERYPPEGNGPGVARYRAQHMLRVELEGARRAGEVLADAVEAGANAIGGITFGFSDPAELARRARESAVHDARAKAQQLTTAAGMSLGPPITIEELEGTNGQPPRFERAAAVLSDTSVAGGELAVQVRVAITFEVGAP